MLSDRPYMRGDYPRETTSVTTWLVCAVAGAFVLQFALDSQLPPPWAGLGREFSLSIGGLKSGQVWTPLTYWLLHSTSNLFHVGLVLAGILVLGRELVGSIGAKRFLAVFGASLIAGATTWSAVNWQAGGELIGATAGIYGLVAVFSLIYPNREINFLLLFFFPVTLRPKHLAISLLVIDVSALVLMDILGRPLPFAYAPSAHLGGMLSGWVYYQFFHDADWRLGKSQHSASHAPSRSPDRLSVNQEESSDAGPSERSPSALRAEADRVLDKINSQGLGALTPRERQVLEDAKALISRR
jgi:membrane associated rhomboid family serine protease